MARPVAGETLTGIYETVSTVGLLERRSREAVFALLQGVPPTCWQGGETMGGVKMKVQQGMAGRLAHRQAAVTGVELAAVHGHWASVRSSSGPGTARRW